MLQTDTGLTTYRITPDAYGTKSRRAVSMVLHFFVTASLMFVGLSAPDFFDMKARRGSAGSRARLNQDAIEAVLFASVLTLSAISSESKEFTLEIASDHIMVYDSRARDPLHRRGQDIPRSRIREVRETRTFPIFGLGTRGLLIE